MPGTKKRRKKGIGPQQKRKKINSGEPFSCENCKQNFSNKQNLNRHIKRGKCYEVPGKKPDPIIPQTVTDDKINQQIIDLKVLFSIMTQMKSARVAQSDIK